MPDISMCKNKECPKATQCYRFMAVPNRYQSWADFQYVTTPDGTVDCEYYWPLVEPEQDRLEADDELEIYCNLKRR